MKNFIHQLGRWLCLFTLVLVSCLGVFGWPQPGLAEEVSLQPRMALANVPLCAEMDQKIDLNNANMIAFQDCPGFYPNLAKTIVIHGPYQKVEDVLKAPGLNNLQRELLRNNLDNFTVKGQVVPLGRRMPPRTAR
ncbi:MAG: photosystem II complex extrinsic protein PsbU [Leptolyngbyaceae cyanobacterium MO_188.B28]|nr:photosystem II complex extrinsic protein PsbU [Leptolyngbyaceae cyanobacterium MO_188.B28]